ncbi:MAG: hypothetical protein HOW97_16285 [Catenulispora sp.]|nr:hypothetical protein [Catenulispora sp.]
MRSTALLLTLGFGLVLAGCSNGTAGAPWHAHAHVVSGARAALTSARLDLATGTDSVVVTSDDLGDKLFQASTPAHSRQVPQQTRDGGTVTVSLADVPGSGPAQVDIVLNSRVSWEVSFDAGASAERVDLTGAHLRALTFAAGASTITALLPAPVGDVPVLMQGGVSTFVVQTPTGVPYQVAFGAGAGSASVEGDVRNGVAAGTVISSPSWDTAANRYTIDNSAGVSAFTLAAH